MKTDDTIPTNLVRLRKVRGLSQEALAEASGLSRAGYRKIEKGKAMPQTESLRSLATALEVPVRELVTPVPMLQHVRFRALKRLKRRSQVLYEVGRWLGDLNELERLVDDEPENRLLELRNLLVDFDIGDMPLIAAEVRDQFGRNDEEPIHDVCGLLEAKGVRIWSVEVASDAFFGLSVGEEDGGPAIVVNTWARLPVELWIFSAVHELAHLLFHMDDFHVDEEFEDKEAEKQADSFASHFLMPHAAFVSEWNDAAGLPLLDRVFKVKRMFRVSWRTVVYRVSESLPARDRGKLWKKIQVDFKRRFGRTIGKHDEPLPIDEYSFRHTDGGEPAAMERHDFQGDHLPRLVRDAVETERITLARAAEILNVSLVEMRELAASWFPSLPD